MPPTELDDAAVVRAYKSLAAVERAFRHLKTVDLELRPFYVRDPDRVRARRGPAQGFGRVPPPTASSPISRP